MRLTRPNVEALKLPPGKSELIVFDEDLPGFGVRLRAGGSIMWIIQYRLGAKQRKVTLGRVSALSPSEARRLASEQLAKVRLGGDPQGERKEARARATVTLASVRDRYLAVAEGRLKARSFQEAARSLRGHWKPLADSPIDKITRAQVAARLAEIEANSGPYARNRARAHLSALYSWAMREGLADGNPVIATNKAVERSRDRVLTDEELVAIWRACRDDFGCIVRLLILTAQRREEVGGMAEDELDLDKGAAWTLPGTRTKNRRRHALPLSPVAVAILRDAPRRQGRSLLFGGGKGGFQGWSAAKRRLDSRIAAERGEALAPWRLHDLRRSAATGMAALGVQPHVVECILNHASGFRGSVAGVYNRNQYLPEMRTGLTLWADHVTKAVEADEARSSDAVPDEG